MTGLTAAQPSFGLGSPLFDRVTIRLNKRYYPGSKLVIRTKDSGEGNDYVSQFKFNGTTLHAPRIAFRQLVKGGTLEFAMSPTPCDRY